MAGFRQRIDNWFEGLARLVFRRRLTALAIMAVLIAAPISKLPDVVLDTSNEGLLHTDDPIIEQYNLFREQFGRDALIIVALKPPEVFDLAFLDRLKALHDDLAANVPYLEEITSLINARQTRGEGDTLIVGELMEDWPRTEADLAALKKRVMANPLYINQLISEDGRFTSIVLRLNNYSSLGAGEDSELAGLTEDQQEEAGEEEKPAFLTNQEQQEAVRAVRAVLDRHRLDGVEVYLAGPPVVGEVLEKAMVGDIYTSVLLVLLTTAICLMVMFRRLSGVILPLVIVNLALGATLGIMAWLGVAVKLPSMVLPAFLMAVGVGASVHVLALFYRRFEESGDKEAAVVYAIGHSGLAIVMTSLTTAAGLASFATASVAPIADMGIFASLGVMLALLYTFILLPALLALIPIKLRRRAASRSVRLTRFLDWTADFSTGHARAIFAVSLVVILVAALGAAQMTFSHNVLKWLPEDLPVRMATEKIDHELKGTVSVEVVIDTGRENGLHDPALLKALDELARRLEGTRQGEIFIGKGTSVADILKEIHQALNENRPEFYAIPDNAALVAQEFLLFESAGSDDLELVVDSTFRKARFTARAPWGDSILYAPFLENLNRLFSQAVGPEVDVTVTGAMTLFFRTVSASIISMARSYSIAFVVITLMMILLIGNLKIGLIAMLPNLAPILITMGVMGWFGLPLDMVTMLTGSITIGLAVDDTVHFMHHFRRYHSRTGDVPEAVHKTLDTAGRAMIVTTVVLSLGFLVMTTATLRSIVNFGLLTGVTVILALLADFFLAPALMMLVYQRRSRRGP